MALPIDDDDDDDEDLVTIVAPSKLLLPGRDLEELETKAISGQGPHAGIPAPMPAAGARAMPASFGPSFDAPGSFGTPPAASINPRTAPTLMMSSGGGLSARPSGAIADEDTAAPTWFLMLIAGCAVMTAIGVGMLVWLKVQNRW